ncbi:flagellar motor protein MotB [Pseudoalteromonas spongiae]|uniref:flagellar motor protein MotB n=1 Tax=Pseudoalteromonas spongiae TaxID=298657 RepID=UPI003735F309
MPRFKPFKQTEQNDNTHRWLVSYADYMTLMFALFVVMYAMAIIEEEKFSVLSDTISHVFKTTDQFSKGTGKGVSGEGILTSNEPKVDSQLHGISIVNEEKGPELVDGRGELSNLQQKYVGQPLDALEEELKKAISDEIEAGQAQLEKDMNWLTIELSSSLLFASGSAVATERARTVLRSLLPILNANRNYLRVRGYTDNQPINNEVFRSNWHLSVARATEVLVWLEYLGIIPARMAIEGYGEYSPFSDNNDEQGRQQNRKVVIAISKYALPETGETEITANAKQTTEQAVEKLKQDAEKDDSLKVIELPNGGIRITTREQEQ